jgi:hypothetical protein
MRGLEKSCKRTRSNLAGRVVDKLLVLGIHGNFNAVGIRVVRLPELQHEERRKNQNLRFLFSFIFSLSMNHGELLQRHAQDGLCKVRVLEVARAEHAGRKRLKLLRQRLHLQHLVPQAALRGDEWRPRHGDEETAGHQRTGDGVVSALPEELGELRVIQQHGPDHQVLKRLHRQTVLVLHIARIPKRKTIYKKNS